MEAGGKRVRHRDRTAGNNLPYEDDGLEEYKDRLREGLVRYTRRAFRTLPEMTAPRILDIGCGSGVPTLELAKLSDGEITAIDIDQTALDRLAIKIKKSGLGARIKAVKCSLFDIDLPPESFDIIWAEGSINVIGFEKGLREWRRFLKTGGFLVLHDELGNLIEKQNQISRCGYELISYFVVSEDIWWNEYCVPLENRLREIQAKHPSYGKTIAKLNESQREVDIFKQDPERNRSAFFVMRKGQ
ncbi:MAG: class I SAM-dependent methyltransferase [Chloroflexota bacterium]